MREIKFRGWDKKYGSEMVYFDSPEYNSEYHMLAFPTIDDSPAIDLAADWVWMQYTGLKDKKGTEIYEGDIILTKVNAGGMGGEPDDWVDEKGEVYFTEGYFTVKGTLLSGTLAAYCLSNEDEVNTEVIGNIYENPALLGETA